MKVACANILESPETVPERGCPSRRTLDCQPVSQDNSQRSVAFPPVAAGTAVLRRQPRAIHAFSLIEVMIAIAIFFMCSFVILALVSSGLRTARMLRTTRPNAGMLAALESLTNRVDAEGSDQGDFGHMYPDYAWESQWYETGTNGLLQFDYIIKKRGQGVPDSTMSILIYSPGAKSKRLGLQAP